MQCVGTLSWNEVGLAWPARRPSAQNLPLRSPAKPLRRDAEVRQEAAGALRPQPIPGGEARGRGHDGRATHSSDQGLSVGGPAIAPVARPARMEAASLEIDWSQVVRQCMAGDSGAWAELVRAQHRRVYGLCYRFTGNATDAEDLTQDVFLRVFRGLRGYSRRARFTTWLFQVAKNRVIDEIRAVERRPRTLVAIEDAPQLEVVDAPIEQNEAIEILLDEVEKLSPDLKEALLLRDIAGLSYNEISDTLDVTLATVKWRIFKAREEVQQALEEQGVGLSTMGESETTSADLN